MARPLPNGSVAASYQTADMEDTLQLIMAPSSQLISASEWMATAGGPQKVAAARQTQLVVHFDTVCIRLAPLGNQGNVEWRSQDRSLGAGCHGPGRLPHGILVDSCTHI